MRHIDIFLVEPNDQERMKLVDYFNEWHYTGVLDPAILARYPNINKNYPDIERRFKVYPFSSTDTAFAALQTHKSSTHTVSITEIDFPEGMSGIEFVNAIRSNSQTQSCYVIVATNKNAREDAELFELIYAVDMYWKKPYDLDDWVGVLIDDLVWTQGIERQIDWMSGLPKGLLIEKYLHDILNNSLTWTYIDVKLVNSETNEELNPRWQVTRDDIWKMAQLFVASLDVVGTTEDFIGHPQPDNFMIITHTTDPEALIAEINRRFMVDIQQHYTAEDRERGYMLIDGEKHDLLSLSFGMVSSEQKIADIRELVATAQADRRRRDSE